MEWYNLKDSLYRIKNLYWIVGPKVYRQRTWLQFLLTTLILSHPLYPPPMYLSQFLTSLIHFTTSPFPLSSRTAPTPRKIRYMLILPQEYCEQNKK